MEESEKDTGGQDLDLALVEMDQVLGEENQALRTLDADGIDRAATRKAELNAIIRRLVRDVRPGPAHRDLLEGIQRAALANQLLLVHARNSVRSVLALASGQPLDSHPSDSSPPPALRLNLKG